MVQLDLSRENVGEVWLLMLDGFLQVKNGPSFIDLDWEGMVVARKDAEYCVHSRELAWFSRVVPPATLANWLFGLYDTRHHYSPTSPTQALVLGLCRHHIKLPYLGQYNVWPHPLTFEPNGTRLCLLFCRSEGSICYACSLFSFWPCLDLVVLCLRESTANGPAASQTTPRAELGFSGLCK